MKLNLTSLVIVVFGILIIIMNSLYIVNESERAVHLRFREVVKDNVQPGLHVKIPFIDQILKFDGRIQAAYVLEGEYLTNEKKLLIVDSFAMWKVKDVKKFFTATGGISSNASSRLIPRVNESIRNSFGRRSMQDVVEGQRDELMIEVLESVAKPAEDELGIEVVDIRVKKIDLPQSVSENVYKRMSAERARDAQKFRSNGKERSEIIRSTAEKEQRIILAEAYSEAQKIRGQGDAEAANIYAESYAKSPEFFKFYRSLEAYRKTFSGNGNMLVLEPDNPFFNYMESMKVP